MTIHRVFGLAFLSVTLFVAPTFSEDRGMSVRGSYDACAISPCHPDCPYHTVAYCPAVIEIEDSVIGVPEYPPHCRYAICLENEVGLKKKPWEPDDDDLFQRFNRLGKETWVEVFGRR